MRIRICILMIATLFLAQGVMGQTSDLELLDASAGGGLEDLYGEEEFVSIATGSSKPAYRAPAVASVITAEQIKAMGATTLDQALERVPGLHVSLSNQGRLDSVYSIRGIHTKFNPQVLLLMNGLPFPHISGNRPFDFHLPVAAISRIEVIRGPGSAVFGADAYAGVINIITKDAADIDGTVLGGRTGSFDTHDLWLQHGNNWGDWDLALSLEWQRTDGDNDRRVEADLQTSFDQENGTDASLAPGQLSTDRNVLDAHLELTNDDWRLRYWYWRQDDAGLGAGAAQALDPEGDEDYDQHLVDLSYRNSDLVTDWDLSASLNYLYRESDSRFVLFPPRTVLPIGPDGNLNSNSSNLVSFPDGLLGNPSVIDEYTGLDLVALHDQVSHRWRIGAGIRRYKERVKEEAKNFGPGVLDGTESVVDGTLTDVAGTPFVFLPDESRTVWYLSLQDEWQFASDWELTAGVRYDDYSDFGGSINPRLALVWAARHNLTSKFLYGRAFRAPTFTELYSINNPVALGNRDLHPETADDLIEFVPDPGGSTITAQNARDQEGYGFEFEMGWDATETLRLFGNYAWQHSEDQKTGERIPEAPGQQLYLGADWKFLPHWSLNPQLNWVADRRRAEGDLRPEVDDYILVDFTLRRKNIFGAFEAAASVRNLFDEDAREPGDRSISGDLPLDGRSVWAEVSCRY